MVNHGLVCVHEGFSVKNPYMYFYVLFCGLPKTLGTKWVNVIYSFV